MGDPMNNFVGSHEKMTTPVAVKVTYTIPGHEPESQTFDASNTPITPEVATKPEPGEYTYSGQHDAGPLPPPRQGGPMEQLIACVQQAKATNDQYLTAVIQKEKEPVAKKKKT